MDLLLETEKNVLSLELGYCHNLNVSALYIVGLHSAILSLFSTGTQNNYIKENHIKSIKHIILYDDAILQQNVNILSLKKLAL